LVDIMSCDRYLPDILPTSDHIYCQDYWLILCHVTDIYLIFCQWVTISTVRIIGWYYVMWQIFTWYSANERPYLLSGLLVDIMSCDRYLPDILPMSDHIYCQDYWLILCHVTDIYLIFCQWVTISTFRIIGWYRCNITPNISIKVISVKQLNISV
jgi:hypothetical protein